MPICVFAQSLNPSPSKLSVQSYVNATPGAIQIIDAHPRVFKILDPTNGAMMELARRYKQGTPNGKVIVRVLYGI